MSEKKVQIQDFSQFEDSKILRDDEQYLVVKSVLASEIVHQYRDGWAYKPADELEKSTFTFRGIPIKALDHPRGSHIEEFSDVNGRVENPKFRKDLIDPKTKRPCRRGIDAELWFYRDNAPEVKSGPFKAISEQTAKAIRDGTLKDNSIGFTCFNDKTPGEFQGQHYDYVQRNIFANHLAAPIEKGRCPSPYCGINMDAEEKLFIEVQDADLGISYHFDKSKFTDEQAKVWVEKRKVSDCPVCKKIDDLGVSEVSKRLFKQYGKDVLEVLEGKELAPVQPIKQLVFLADFKDAMTLAEIDAKIAELHTQYDALRTQEKAFYDVKKLEPSPELQKLYRQMGDIDLEIKAFTELKAKRIVEGNNDAADKDDVIVKNRQALKDLYSLTEFFSQKIFSCSLVFCDSLSSAWRLNKRFTRLKRD